MVHYPFFASNPFFSAYVHSDFLGKAIFLALLALSIVSWVIIIYKLRLYFLVKKKAEQFSTLFHQQKQQALQIAIPPPSKSEFVNPFQELYRSLQQQSKEVLTKNLHFSRHLKGKAEQNTTFLSRTDIELLEGQLSTKISSLTKHLENNLFLLDTIKTLSPFLGLLGTVWGIVISFSGLHGDAGIGSSQMILQGLSLALTATILGLTNAIPALIGYSFLKQKFRDFTYDMEAFTSDMLATVELQYRQVDLDA